MIRGTRSNRLAERRAGLRRRAAGRARPPWSPHADPRLDALAAGFALLLDAVVDAPEGTASEGAAAPPSSAFMIKELPG